MSTKISKQTLPLPISYSKIPQPAFSPTSPTSISTTQHIQTKLKLCNKMHKSLKTKNMGLQPKSDVDNKLNVYSISKVKKFSDSYYYTNTNNQENKIKEINGQSKIRNQQRKVSNKNSKSKLIHHRKTEKIKTQPHIENNFTNSNHRSLNRLISSMSNSELPNKLQTLRTFSPEVQFISEQLSQKRKIKKLLKSEEEIIDRLAKVLEQYKQSLIKQRKQKDVLAKENRRLKEKIQILNGEKKYKTVQEYNV